MSDVAGLKLHNMLSRQVSDRDETVVLFDRLLWLRNHYEDACQPRPMKAIRGSDIFRDVLADVDAVLARFRP